MECGLVTSRLQWTHFKYKCSGKYKTIKEYRQAHPDSIIVDPELASRCKATLENMIRKYGEDEGNARWRTYIERQAYTNSFEYKKKQHNWTKDQFDSYNKSRAVTLDNLIKKHGIDKGNQVWENYVEKQRYTNSIEYFKEKFGNKGEARWKSYNKEKAKSHDVHFVAEKYNVSIAQALEILSERFAASNPFSKAEVEFVNLLEAQVGTIKYTANTKQYSIWNKDDECINFYDIADHTKLKIIEFNGDYWHCNPIKYNADYIHPTTGELAKEIWDKDSHKINAALSRGFTVKVVWCSDFINNKEKTIREVAKWWNQP